MDITTIIGQGTLDAMHEHSLALLAEQSDPNAYIRIIKCDPVELQLRPYMSRYSVQHGTAIFNTRFKTQAECEAVRMAKLTNGRVVSQIKGNNSAHTPQLGCNGPSPFV